MSTQVQSDDGVTPPWHMGDRLAKALGYAEVSHHEMAEFLGVSRNTVGNYIALRSPVNAGTLRLWALRTGVNLAWLTDGEAAPGGSPPPRGPAGGDHGLADLTERKRVRARQPRGDATTGRYPTAA